MRWLVRGAIAVALLLVLAVGGLLAVLPKLAASESTRARIQQASRDAIGRELDYESIDFGLLPPSLQVLRPRLAGATPEAPPLASAERIGLRAALLPLLRGALEVRSLVAVGLELELVRTAEGLELPRREPRTPAASPGKGPKESDGGAGEGPKLPVDVRRVLLTDSRIRLEDRAVVPVQIWELRDVQLEGRPRGSELELDGSAELASGGAIELSGSIDLGGEADLRFDLDDVALVALSPYLGERVDGRLGGSVRATGPTGDPAVEAELRASDAAYGATALSGPADLTARLDSVLSQPRGPFALDLSDAALTGSGFAKPAGTRAQIRGTLGSDTRGELAVDDLRLALRNLEASGALRTAPRPTLTLSAEPFDVKGWGEIVPALALLAPEGRLALSELSVRSAPLDARGNLRIEDGRARLGREIVGVSGAIELLGDALQGQELAVRAAEQLFQVGLRVDSLFDTPRYRVDFETAEEGADVDALLATFAGQEGRVYGPLVGGGRLEGELGGEVDFLEAVRGEMRFGIEDGRIVGVSLLESVLGPLGARLSELGRDRVGGDLKRFYDERFESLSAALRISDGKVLSEPLDLVYQGYSARLEGPIALNDLALDLRGSLTLHEELDATLARAFGAGKDYAPRRRTLPLAAVRGSLGEPKVQLSGSAVEQIATAYAADAYQGELRKKVEKELGPGSGQIVDEGLRVLDGLLGGGRPRRPEPAPPPEAGAEPPADR